MAICYLGGDPSRPRYCERIAGYISTGLLQHWYQFQVRAHASAVVNFVVKDADRSFDSCHLALVMTLGFGGQILVS